jgi:hypothetical protein
MILVGDDRCDNNARMSLYVVCRLYVRSNATALTHIQLVCTIQYNGPNLPNWKFGSLNERSISVDQQSFNKVDQQSFNEVDQQWWTSDHGQMSRSFGINQLLNILVNFISYRILFPLFVAQISMLFELSFISQMNAKLVHLLFIWTRWTTWPFIISTTACQIIAKLLHCIKNNICNRMRKFRIFCKNSCWDNERQTSRISMVNRLCWSIVDIDCWSTCWTIVDQLVERLLLIVRSTDDQKWKFTGLM